MTRQAGLKLTTRRPKEAPETEIEFLREGIRAEGHTPVYKMHKYFARRPQNVFRMLLERYSRPGDIVVDCFCGGGVTLVEGIATARRVIAVDVNPLATFVTDCQTTTIDVDSFLEEANAIRKLLYDRMGGFFVTRCRSCNEVADVRWYEAAYLVACPICDKTTSLAEDNRVIREGKALNGHYACEECQKVYRAADLQRQDSVLLKVRYKCSHCSTQETVAINEGDLKRQSVAIASARKIIDSSKGVLPTDKIPLNWDRQHEDCLLRKGYVSFLDFFSLRNLAFNAACLTEVRNRKSRVSEEIYRMLLFLFSAVIRYTGNLNFSTPSWMDGRPVAWAKHAYWLPNQYVEVNPFEYFDKRVKFIRSGLKFQMTHIPESKRVESFGELKDGRGTHAIWTRSSDCLDVPDSSVDLVLTDPPYGSNVQYGELSWYWLTWLKKDLQLEEGPADLNKEILVHRKLKDDGKTFADYANGLQSVFCEMHRILRPGRPLVFTFNNKNLKAWAAVLHAASKAGFDLNDGSVVYQEPISLYNNTAHTRYKGTVQGDFIYTFVKPVSPTPVPKRAFRSASDFGEEIRRICSREKRLDPHASLGVLHTRVVESVVPQLAELSKSFDDFDDFLDLLSKEKLDKAISKELSSELATEGN